MKALAFTALILVAQSALAEELYCTGTVQVGSEKVESSSVMQWDPETLHASLDTASGVATGKMSATPKLYMGHLTTSKGVVYWFNLDRYTGQLIYGQSDGGDGRMDRIEFVGTCAKRDRLF